MQYQSNHSDPAFTLNWKLKLLMLLHSSLLQVSSFSSQCLNNETKLTLNSKLMKLLIAKVNYAEVAGSPLKSHKSNKKGSESSAGLLLNSSNWLI